MKQPIASSSTPAKSIFPKEKGKEKVALKCAGASGVL